jgi:hypothetical protein
MKEQENGVSAFCIHNLKTTLMFLDDLVPVEHDEDVRTQDPPEEEAELDVQPTVVSITLFRLL